MSKNSLILLSLIQILILTFEGSCRSIEFVPTQRYLHTATHIDNKLYILGGLTFNENNYITEKNKAFIGTDKQFFYFDMSIPFNTKTMLWVDQTDFDIIPNHIAATSSIGCANNNTFLLYGGKSLLSRMDTNLVYAFNTQTNSWSVPKLTDGNFNIKKDSLKGIMHNGKMYLFGGLIDGQLSNDMLIFDTINMNFTTGSSVNAPSPRKHYGAALFDNQYIAYFGGKADDIGEFQMSEIHIYDTMNDSWTNRKSTGNVPTARSGFSVVLGLDGKRLIIFGGNQTYLPEALYVLDLQTFVWSIPKTSSGRKPKARFLHQANVIGNFMVITFGMGYNTTLKEHDVLLLDISNNDEYKWTNVFDPSPPETTSLPMPPTPSSSSFYLQQSNGLGALVGAVIGSLFSGISLSFGSILLYRWHKDRKYRRQAIPTPGERKIIN
ncbi:8280_t:CDS:2 [Funneliformis caledonium]|uniref:8280_t:CDS:1 n=1 Tax=Funneliformis caledonium TaxID=1117310 RepID=A0A9N8ZQ19_9GLOM|nr:8280_t:CDS:2 [Funneliformis caledonium]